MPALGSRPFSELPILSHCLKEVLSRNVCSAYSCRFCFLADSYQLLKMQKQMSKSSTQVACKCDHSNSIDQKVFVRPDRESMPLTVLTLSSRRVVRERVVATADLLRAPGLLTLCSMPSVKSGAPTNSTVCAKPSDH